MKQRMVLSIAALAVALVVVGQVSDAWARARGGGSRGSRTYSAPARPSSPASPTTPTSPSLNQPSPSAPMAQRPSMFRGFGGALMGFALGGLLGSLLFGGLGAGFGGIGLMDILLIGGGLFALLYFLRRRQTAAEPAYAGGASRYTGNTGAGGTAVLEMPAGGAARSEVADGVDHIRQMDPAFDPAAFANWVRSQFGNVQAAVATRDVGILRDRLAPEMWGVLETQCEELRAAGRRSYVGDIDLSHVEVTEAWQEKGHDFVTVGIEGTMVEYVADEASGRVVEGSKTQPAKVDEFWTFTRPVGPNTWKLSAIQS
ncbi:MAG: Tim44 domain-containing protein [Candidatus Rokubacteria bacterium]|nr:Tim44 domain-containing protein [Candidatus Rokubacteria bacterium]